mgnify:CR=1 FL=1|tara:strand:- start:429 stop:971 length:543 start_codon:yes stop_codon:yes gene_type:complete
MSLKKQSGCTEPNNLKSVNPYVTVKGNILVSECCKSEAVYRVSDEYGFDRWDFCPQCLECCEWVEKSIHKDNQENKGKYPHYEDVLKVLDDDGFYDGHFDDLLPWTFSLSDFQHPDREIDLLVDLWNGNLEDVLTGSLGNGGYIYYVEAHALLYEIVISPNMGLDCMNIIATTDDIDEVE